MQVDGRTVAMDIGYIQFGGLHISLFGTPGLLRFQVMQSIIRSGADGIVFVFDASNSESDKAAISLLNDLKDSKTLRIYLANKQDINGARSPEELKSKFSLPKESKIFASSTKSGSNVKESLKYLVDQIFNRYKKLFGLLLEYETNIRGLAEKLRKNKAQMRELLYKLEVKRFIKLDRINKTYKVSNGLKNQI